MAEIEELLKIKEEEIEKLNKMKDALKSQLAKVKEENAQLKAGGAGAAAPPSAGVDSDLLKAKEEEIEKLSKMKDMLKDQLLKVKEENAQLKAGGAGAAAPPATGADSDLLKAKDEEIEKLNKLKDALKLQLGKAKEEITQLKASGSASVSAPVAGPDPEILKSKDKEIEKLINANNQTMGENAKLNMEMGDLKDQITDFEKKIAELSKQLEEAKKVAIAAPKPQTSEAVKDGDATLSVDQILQQVKNGMFKLGSQNHSIEEKIDEILEKLEKVGSMPAASSAASTIAKEPIASKMAKFDGGSKAPAMEMQKAQIEEAPKIEDSESSSRKGLKAPAVMFGSGEEAPKQIEPDVFTRKPSDTSRGVERQSPQRAISLKPMGKPEGDEEVHTAKPSAIASGGGGGSAAGGMVGGIQTLPYPADGVLKCPNCGEQNFKEMENRAKVISFVPTKKYGKKYYCKQCRSEWDYELS